MVRSATCKGFVPFVAVLIFLATTIVHGASNATRTQTIATVTYADYITAVNTQTPMANTPVTLYVFGNASTTARVELAAPTDSLGFTIQTQSITDNPNAVCSSGLPSLGVTASGLSSNVVFSSAMANFPSSGINKVYKLCSSAGEDTMIHLYAGHSIVAKNSAGKTITAVFGSRAVLPQDNSTTQSWASSSFTLQSGTGSSVSYTQMRTTGAWSDTQSLYLVQDGNSGGCSQSNVRNTVSVDSSNAFKISRDLLFLADTGSTTSLRLCFLGSDVLGLAIDLVQSITANSKALSSSVDTTFTTTSEAQVSLVLTLRAPSTTFAAGTFYVCDSANPTLSASSRGTIAAGTVTSSGGNLVKTIVLAVNVSQVAQSVGICWNLFSDTIRLYSGISVHGVSVSSVDGVAASAPTVHVIRPVASSFSWTVLSSGVGSLVGATVFPSVQTTCSVVSGTVATASGTAGNVTVSVPANWYSAASTTDFTLCAYLDSTVVFALNSFKLRVVQVDSLVRVGDTLTSKAVVLDGESVSFQVSGTITDVTQLTLGVVQGSSGKCFTTGLGFLANGTSSITSTVIKTLAGASNGNLCVASTATSGISQVTPFSVVSVSSIGLNGHLSLFALDSTVQTMPVTFSTTDTAILSSLSLTTCTSTTSIAVGAMSSPYTSVDITAGSTAVGSASLCLQYGSGPLASVSIGSLAVVPTPLSNNTFSAVAGVTSGDSYSIAFSNQFTADHSNIRLAIVLTTTTTGPVSLVPTTLLTPTPGSQTISFVPGMQNPTTLAIWGAIVSSGADATTTTTFATQLGTIEYATATIGKIDVPSSPTRVFGVDGTTPTGSQTMTFSITTSQTVTFDFALSTVSNCSSPQLASGTAGISSADNTMSIDVPVLAAFPSSSQPVLCMRLKDINGSYFDTGIRMAMVSVATYDSQPFTSQANMTQSVVSVVLSGASRDISVTGNNMNIPQSWSILFFLAANASCATTSPDRTLSMAVQSTTTALATFPQVTAMTYQTMCFVFVDANSGASQYISTNVISRVADISAVSVKRTDGTQQSSIVGVRNAVSTLPLVMDSGKSGSSYPLPLSTRFHYVSASTKCLDANETNRNELPIFLSGSTLNLVVNGTAISQGKYNLCMLSVINGQTYSATVGMTLTMLFIQLGLHDLGSNEFVGATMNYALDLRVTGSYLNDAFIYISATDSSCAGSLSGTTAYGNSRALSKVTGCGSTFATGTIPASNAKTVAPHMEICLSIWPAADGEPAAGDLQAFNSGVYLAVTEPTQLVILQNLPATTDSNSGVISQQPILSLLDQSSGATLGAIPSALTIKTTWYITSPVQDTIPGSTMAVEAGATAIDFSTQGNAVQLKGGKYGYKYVLQFEAVNSVLISVNSTEIELGACTNPTQLAVVYTDTCEACPASATCDGTLSMRVADSSWRPHNLSTNLYSCDTPYMDRSCSPNTTLGECRTGHSGPRCSVCDVNYANSFDVCVKCDSQALNIFLVVLALVVVLVIVIVLVLSTLQCKKSDQFPIYIKLLLNHLTVSSTLEFSRNIPTILISLFKVQRQVSRPSPAFAAFDCATGASWYTKFIVVNSIPIGFAIVLAVLLQFKKAVQARDEKAERRRSLNEAGATSPEKKTSTVIAFATPNGEKSLSKQSQQERALSSAASKEKKAHQQEGSIDDMQKEFSTVPPMKMDGLEGFGGEVTQSVDVDLKHEVTPSGVEMEEGTGSPTKEGKAVSFSAEVEQRGEKKRRGTLLDEDEDEAAAEAAELQRKQTENLGLLQVHGVVAKQERRHIFVVTMIIILFFSYPSIVEWCANVLRCDPIDYSTPIPGELSTPPQSTRTIQTEIREYFYYDRSKECTSGEHQNYVTAGLVLGLFYGFGTPAASIYFFYRLKQSKRAGGIGKVAASRMFTFLVAGYRKETWWWEAPMMVKKLMLIYVWAFVTSSRLQTILAFWVIVAHLVAHNKMSPYEYEVADEMERASLFVMCITLNLSFLFEWVNINDTDLQYQIYAYVLLVLVLLLNIVVTLWMIRQILLEGWIKFTKFLRDEEAWIREKWSHNCCTCFIEWILKYKYVTPPILHIDEDGEAVQLNEEDLTAEELHAIKEQDSASDWSEEDDQSTVAGGSDNEREDGEGGNNMGAENKYQQEDDNFQNDLDRNVLQLSAGEKGAASIYFKSNDPGVLKGIARSLREQSEENKRKFFESQEKVHQTERIIEVFKKQLQISEDYSNKVERDLQKQIDTLVEVQKEMKALEDEVVILKAGSAPRERITRAVAKEMKHERDELRKKLAEAEMSQSPHAVPVGSNIGAPTPGAGGEGGFERKGTSTVLFNQIGEYRRRLQNVQATKEQKIRAIQDEARLTNDLRQAMFDGQREEQQRIIRQKIEEKQRIRMERSLKSQSGHGQRDHDDEGEDNSTPPPAVSETQTANRYNGDNTPASVEERNKMMQQQREGTQRDKNQYNGDNTPASAEERHRMQQQQEHDHQDSKEQQASNPLENTVESLNISHAESHLDVTVNSAILGSTVGGGENRLRQKSKLLLLRNRVTKKRQKGVDWKPVAIDANDL